MDHPERRSRLLLSGGRGMGIEEVRGRIRLPPLLCLPSPYSSSGRLPYSHTVDGHEGEPAADGMVPPSPRSLACHPTPLMPSLPPPGEGHEGEPAANGAAWRAGEPEQGQPGSHAPESVRQLWRGMLEI